MNVARVFIGWDSREPRAWEVAERTLRARASCPVLALPLRLDRITEAGLIQRTRFRDVGGKLWDDVSACFVSTEFAITRFLAPLFGCAGWVLFCDADVVFVGDVAELFALADERYAVMCVKHDYTPRAASKMDGQSQTAYPRKNWSSVMLVNCDHQANRRLTLGLLNTLAGKYLHRYCWLNDEEIGALPPEWNVLVGEQEIPPAPKLLHFTLGGPFTPGWSGAPYDELWNKAAQQ